MIDGIDRISGPGGIAPLPPLRPRGARAVTGAGTGDFATYLATAARDATATVRAAEATAIRGIEDKADLQQVVDKVMEAERTLSTALAIRNKLIAAWQEISRMQI